jgi:hypothetical protein
VDKPPFLGRISKGVAQARDSNRPFTWLQELPCQVPSFLSLADFSGKADLFDSMADPPFLEIRYVIALWFKCSD